MRSKLRLIIGGAVLAGAALGLGACESTHGVYVQNATDQVVRAEMLTVNTAGESSVYSTALISSGATFVNRMPEPVRGQTMRVRLILENQTADDNNWIMLSLPDKKKPRHFVLHLENGRLRADEAKRRNPLGE